MFRVANLRVPEWNRAPVGRARRNMLKLCAVAVFEVFLGLSEVCQQPTSPAPTGNANAATQPQKPDGFQSNHKLGPLDIAADWRVRAEGWNWFESDSGDSDYAFTHSLLRISVGQRTEHLDWKLEGAQD